MSNVKRLLLSNRVFFITTNLRKDRYPMVAEEYPLIISAFAESRQKLSFGLYGYVLMPDHWHALIGVAEPLTISRAVQDIKWIASRSLNKRRGTRGPFWQHQFWDRFVRHSKEFGERLAYMHMNPVRKGLVANQEQWRWSSYNNLALDKEVVAACPIQIDDNGW